MIEKINIKQLIENFVEGKYSNNKYSVKESLMAQKLDEKYIYNEISLQHELENYLREELDGKYVIQFERNIGDLGYSKEDYRKKEIDIVIFNKEDKDDNYAIELKYHRGENGRYHDTTADCVKDIEFLNQLINDTKLNANPNIKKKFKNAYCLTIVEDSAFYNNTRAKGWNYWCFREGVEVDKNSKKEVTYSDKNRKEIEIDELIEKGFLPIRFCKGKNNSGWKEICNDNNARYYIVEI